MQRPTTCQGRVLAFVTAAIATLAAAPALAAPQVLALVATDVPVPLRCADGTCSAELASLCLQPERRAPEAGRQYLPHRQTTISVIDDNAVHRLTLPDSARFVATRTHVAVRLELPQAWMTRHLPDAAAIEIAETTALVPVALPGDAQALSKAELARTTGGDIALAASVIREDPARRAAIALSGHLINALPDDADAAAIERLWQGMAAALPAELQGQAATGLARFQLDWCRYSTDHGLSPGLKHCLAAQQDRAMEALHSGYLEILGAGS